MDKEIIFSKTKPKERDKKEMAHFILYVFRWQLKHLGWTVYHLSDLIFYKTKLS